jgi:hypothetical protein
MYNIYVHNIYARVAEVWTPKLYNLQYILYNIDYIHRMSQNSTAHIYAIFSPFFFYISIQASLYIYTYTGRVKTSPPIYMPLYTYVYMYICMYI